MDRKRSYKSILANDSGADVNLCNINGSTINANNDVNKNSSNTNNRRARIRAALLSVRSNCSSVTYESEQILYGEIVHNLRLLVDAQEKVSMSTLSIT